MTGKVYIASMKMRGKWAERPENNTIINVTSMQSKSSSNRRDFSPMSEIKGKYKNYYCFENYWQSGKVYEEIDVEKYKNWWQNLTQGKRRFQILKVNVFYILFIQTELSEIILHQEKKYTFLNILS